MNEWMNELTFIFNLKSEKKLYHQCRGVLRKKIFFKSWLGVYNVAILAHLREPNGKQIYEVLPPNQAKKEVENRFSLSLGRCKNNIYSWRQLIS